MRRALFIFAALFTWCDFIHADHRSALVIANHNYAAVELKLDAPDLKAVVARLERHGFQCTVKSNLDNNQLKRAIEDFAVRTPVRGTGLVYFIGQAAPGEYQGSKTLCLLDTKSKPGRGLGLDYVFAQLHAKGGSTRQLVVVDAPKVAAQSMEFPEGCSLALGDGEKVFKTLGKASQAISPSNKLGPAPADMVTTFVSPATIALAAFSN